MQDEPIDQELVDAIQEEEKKNNLASDRDKFAEPNLIIKDHRDSLANRPAQDVDEPVAQETEQDQ